MMDKHGKSKSCAQDGNRMILKVFTTKRNLTTAEDKKSDSSCHQDGLPQYAFSQPRGTQVSCGIPSLEVLGSGRPAEFRPALLG